jgi:hypothetical protein
MKLVFLKATVGTEVTPAKTNKEKRLYGYRLR